MSSKQRARALIQEMEALRAELRAMTVIIGSACGGVCDAALKSATMLQERATEAADVAKEIIDQEDE